jgi:hypothetical protein
MLVWVELGAFVFPARDDSAKIAYLRAIPTFDVWSHLTFLGKNLPLHY